MRRLIVAAFVAAATFCSGALAAPPWPQNADGTPSVMDPSIPLSYVGNDEHAEIAIADGRAGDALAALEAVSDQSPTPRAQTLRVDALAAQRERPKPVRGAGGGERGISPVRRRRGRADA